MVASGLAWSCPAMSGALPWTGSYMPTLPPRLADGNMPMEPVSIAASSLRIRPVVNATSNAARAMKPATTSAAIGSRIGIPARAPASAKRRAFETPAEQIALFADTPLPEQVASLEQSLEEIEETPDQMSQLVADWMAGDLAALDRDALGPLRDASPV